MFEIVERSNIDGAILRTYCGYMEEEDAWEDADDMAAEAGDDVWFDVRRERGVKNER